MCARLGIRVAYSQAYRAQANGRAERAGRTIISALRKLSAESQNNWVEMLPRVLWAHHATPGEMGMSPFQVLFGRERGEPGVPYSIPRECEGATVFFDRMARVDVQVAKALNDAHAEVQRSKNAKRVKRPPFKVGDWVWVKRPKSSPLTAKLDTWWVGPTEVVKRLEDQSYEVRIKPNRLMEVHASDLKPYEEDRLAGRPIELFHYLPSFENFKTAPDEWNVETILGHRRRDGRSEFLVKWAGCGRNESTWEPIESFVLRYNDEWVVYCRAKGLLKDLTEHLEIGDLEAQVGVIWCV